MSMGKTFKDPIYGYMEIPCNLVENVIDTPQFQRLRNIRQTSYDPLYPSATHNRFVHSLGVYHLGCLVSDLIKKQVVDEGLCKKIGSKKAIERFVEVLQFACLLHDFGHAPFSHTGEGLYKDKSGGTTYLHERIDDLIGGSVFRDYLKQNLSKAAAPHELMSVIVSLVVYGDDKSSARPKFFRDLEEKEFFARAITGYRYSDRKRRVGGVRSDFLDCLIALLNSSLVDVDRLDYLMRDAFTTGFNTMMIDYCRLLKGLRIEVDEGGCRLVYTKGAISILENVIYAHDSERKWVQNHPSILYEMHLLKRAMRNVRAKYPDVFSERAISAEGVPLSKMLSLKFLSDGDVVFLMRNADGVDAERYFDRNKRLHPLWKSETEFHSLFSAKMWNSETWKDFAGFAKEFLSYIEKTCDSEINEKALSNVKIDLRVAKRKVRNLKTEEGVEGIIAVKRHVKLLLFQAVIELFKDFADRNKIEFQFDLIKANAFKSGFYKKELSKVFVRLPVRNDLVEFGNVTNLFSDLDSEGANTSVRLSKEVFYIYCDKGGCKTGALAKDFVNSIRKFVNDKLAAIQESRDKHS